jgi:5-methylthioadenosine/S-adenosylhomocysteine deaminase
LLEAKENGTLSDRIQISVGPHAIYTVSKDNLIRAFKLSKEHDLFFHIHCSETQQEVSLIYIYNSPQVDDCIAQHGMTPVAYLNSLSALTPKTILAHCVHLTEEDIKIIKQTGAVISHQPSLPALDSSSFSFQLQACFWCS